MKLSEIATGGKARLVKVTGDSSLVERLHEIGLIPGTEVEVHQRLPLRGPLVLKYFTTRMALRLVDAECIEVESL
jgi:Fe2+ transport system protein FeoA